MKTILFVLVASISLATAPTAVAALFPPSARGSYQGTLRIVDTKYGVNLQTTSTFRISANSTRFSSGRDPIRFRSDGTATNVNWVSARYTTRRHAVIISGQIRDSSDPSAGPGGSFRYIIRFKAGGVVTVASTSSYSSGGVQTVQFAGRK